jgi:hypothetical protein
MVPTRPSYIRPMAARYWESEPSLGIARWQASAASMDAVISPVRGLRPLSVWWLSSLGRRWATKSAKGSRVRSERCVASIDAAGAGWGSCLWLDVAGASCPGPAGCALCLVRRSLGGGGSLGEGGRKHGTAERCELGRRGGGRRGGLLFVCADRGGAPQLHQTDGCAVWGLEPSPWIARRVGSAASIDASNSPVRGLHPLRLLWPSSEKIREGRRPPRGGRPRCLRQRSPAGFDSAGLRGVLGGEESVGAAEEGCALRRLAEGGPQEAQRG